MFIQHYSSQKIDLIKTRSKSLFLTIFSASLLILICSCYYKDQLLVIEPNSLPITRDPSFGKFHNKKINLRIVDSRKHKNFIGFKNPVSIWNFKDEYKDPEYFNDIGGKATLTTNQNIAEIVEKEFLQILDRKGFSYKRFAPNQLVIEISEFGFMPTMYNSYTHSKIIVHATNKKNKHFTKVYNMRNIDYETTVSAIILGPFNTSLPDEYFNEIMSEFLYLNTQSIIDDEELWNFFN